MCIRDRSREAHEVEPLEDFRSNVIKADIVADLLEEENNTSVEVRTGLTEIQVKIANKNYRTLVDTGSKISVMAENILGAVSYTHLDVYKRQPYNRFITCFAVPTRTR